MAPPGAMRSVYPNGRNAKVWKLTLDQSVAESKTWDLSQTVRYLRRFRIARIGCGLLKLRIAASYVISVMKCVAPK